MKKKTQGKSKVAVLFIDNTFTFGGAINSLLYLLDSLDKKKYIPVLITGQNVRFLRRHLPGSPYYSVNLKLPWVHNSIYTRIASTLIGSNRFLMAVVNKLRVLYWSFFVTIPESIRYYRIGKKHDVQLVHLNNIFCIQLAGILCAKFLRVPCIAHMRDFSKVSSLTRLMARLVDHHIAISSAIKAHLLEFGVAEEKITLVHDAIDLDRFDTKISCDYLRDEFNLTRDAKLFGMFGRIVEWKGVKEFVRSSAGIFRLVPDSKAFIVGDASDADGQYLKEVIRLIHELKVEDRVILTGYREDIPALMKLMDVIVQPTITPEPFGMVLVEGMAMGKPVVATKIGGPLDIVEDDETGFLVPPEDLEEMSNAIANLLSDPLLREKMGQKGRKRAEARFYKERYARQVEEIYSSQLEKIC